MIGFSLFGAGRIGKVHAHNIALNDQCHLAYVVDVDHHAATLLAEKYGAKVAGMAPALSDSAVDAVIIASSTDTHADLIELSAQAKKAIFCEKPIHLEIARTRQCIDIIKKQSVICQVGFNRRFDPDFARIKTGITESSIGELHFLSITSRDPYPPPVDYIKVSGGLFRDMTIHDFDMARWLMGEEPIEIHAMGSCLINPALREVGDIDTATLSLRTASGKLCQINNSRQAVYGYDQRIEAFGSDGMLQSHHRTETHVIRTDKQGIRKDSPQTFFLERYEQAYKLELQHFVESLKKGIDPIVNQDDGLRALELAIAAQHSLQKNRPIRAGGEHCVD